MRRSFSARYKTGTKLSKYEDVRPLTLARDLAVHGQAAPAADLGGSALLARLQQFDGGLGRQALLHSAEDRNTRAK